VRNDSATLGLIAGAVILSNILALFGRLVPLSWIWIAILGACGAVIGGFVGYKIGGHSGKNV
jgi:membrane protein YqaA with SNARE-associated domain